jgi:hypothetical protein
MEDRLRRIILLISSIPLFAQMQPAWVTVVDPQEKAFSIDVPQGWKVNGGMFRFGLIDARPFVDMTSPDGRISVRVGDVTIPSYNTPNPMLHSLHAEGPHVAPYATGDEFATRYGLARFSSMCRGVQVTKAGPLPPKYGRAAQGRVRVTAGAAGFTCMANGSPMVGFVYSETMLVQAAGPVASSWYVIALGSVLAPMAQGQMAGAILKHASESIALNPEWAKTQGQLIGQATTALLNVAEATRQATAEQQRRSQAQMKERAREVDNFNDVLLGQAFTRDAQTGKEWVVPNGAGGTKWMDYSGTVAESAMSPGPGFHRLDTVSR